MVLRRDKKFWSYHKSQLIQAGVGFSRWQVLKGAVLEMGRAALSPKRSVEKLLKKQESTQTKGAKSAAAAR